MEQYRLGKTSFVMNLLWTAVSWQVFSIGVDRVDIRRFIPLLERHHCSGAAYRSLPCGGILPLQDGWNEGGWDGSGHLEICILCVSTLCG